MPRPRNTEQRRDEIVRGLMTVMAERGYERASVAEVARSAGLTPGLVHYHFPSKQAILLRLVARLGDELEERLERRIAGADDERARIVAFIDVHLARGNDADPRALVCWVTIAAEALRQPAVGEAFREVLERRHARLLELVRAALRAEGRSQREARRIAAAILGGIEGAYVLGTAAPRLIPAGSAATTLGRVATSLLDGVR